MLYQSVQPYIRSETQIVKNYHHAVTILFRWHDEGRKRVPQQLRRALTLMEYINFSLQATCIFWKVHVGFCDTRLGLYMISWEEKRQVSVKRASWKGEQHSLTEI